MKGWEWDPISDKCLRTTHTFRFPISTLGNCSVGSWIPNQVDVVPYSILMAFLFKSYYKRLQLVLKLGELRTKTILIRGVIDFCSSSTTVFILVTHVVSINDGIQWVGTKLWLLHM